MKKYLVILSIFSLSLASCQNEMFSVLEDNETVFIESVNYSVFIHKNGFRFGFKIGTDEIVIPEHAHSGLHFLEGDVVSATLTGSNDSTAIFEVVNSRSRKARVTMFFKPDYLRFSVEPEEIANSKIHLRTGGISPGYGLGEHAGYPTHPGSPESTELTGYKNDSLLALIGHRFVGRMISNFVIFPKHQFAEVAVEPFIKVFRLDSSENTIGATYAKELKNCYYFFGNPETIYRSFLEVRNKTGNLVMKPKYEFFGVGWEAWGALGWTTNQKTVEEYVNSFLNQGYPLEWMVIGSGFWPQHDKSLHATTSFGMWDEKLFPSPQNLINEMHEKGLKVFIGLRIYFIENGPYTSEGLMNNFFINDSAGEPKLFDRIGFPKSPCYILDAQNDEAVQWYVNLCQLWLDEGIDGFKEDMYGFHQPVIRGEKSLIEGGLRDDRVDPINEALMKKGVYIMGRNNYLGSAADIHRIEDFNIDHNQDRGPICGLSFAYSGFPYVYPDVVGGEPYYRDEVVTTDKFKRYLSRFAMYAAVNPVMAFGNGPWISQDQEIERIILKSARFHSNIHPYIYSYAIKTWKTGFPWTLTPLKLVFPEDNNTYLLEDTVRRGYQWMIGESLMAYPLYGNDYFQSDSRDVYLPMGQWLDFETGNLYTGPVTLHDFHIPLEKLPVFVGGKAILLWQDKQNASLEAWVFPNSPKGSTVDFVFPDGDSSCKVKNDISTWNINTIQILNENGEVQDFRSDKFGSIRFFLTAGHTYTLSNK